MSSRARRLGGNVHVSPFVWRPSGSDVPPARVPAANVPAANVVSVEAPSAESLAALERDAFAKGFAQGERAGAEAAGKRGEAMLRRLTDTLQELTAARATMIQETEQQMVRLALAIARRVIGREISLDHDLLLAIARVALERLGESARMTVRLHPDDYEATAAAHAAQWNGSSVQVVADAIVGRGGCRVESEFGLIDAGIDAQMQELARALLGEEETVHETVPR
jgi:flagellar assembly protein FliH